MPQVEVTYLGLIAQAIGRRGERRALAAGATLGDLLQALEREHGEPLRELLFDPQHRLVSNALVAIDGQATRDLATPVLQDGSVVRIVVMSPMMIGG